MWVGAAMVAAAGAVVLWTSGSDDGRVTTEASLVGATQATLDAETARIMLRSDDARDDVVGVIRFGPDGVLQFTYPRDDDVSEFRVFPDRAYALHAGHWMTFTNDEMNSDTGIAFPNDASPLLTLVDLLVHSLDHADPDSVVETGADVNHGDPVRVFEATVDIGAAVRSVAEITDPEEADDFLEIFGPDLTVHVDDAGRARYVRLDGGDELVEIELWDFGVEVDVARPDVGEYQPPEPGDPLDETELCAAADQTVTETIFSDPSTSPTAWSEAGAAIDELAEVARDPAIAVVGTQLSSMYRDLGDALAAGSTIAELRANGVDTEFGLLDWTTLEETEERFTRLVESRCP